jgi:predicted TIM-barrel fold metal-dependent hydrolase
MPADAPVTNATRPSRAPTRATLSAAWAHGPVAGGPAESASVQSPAMTTSSSAAVRERLGHPVVDVDGHNIEYFPALAGYLREEGVDPGEPALRHLLPGAFGPPASWYALTPAERAYRRVARPPFWGAPMRNTRDLATAMFPKLLYERLDEIGLDFSVIYPSVGLVFMHLEDERIRRGACRALNRYNADAFRELSDRLTPVAAIPMHTPAEAIEELEHAVDVLGFRAVLFAGYVQRPVGVVADRDPELARYALWLDMYGIDSAYDYDPLWAKCLELRVPAAFHSGSIGWGSRASITSYMYNHLGHLAEGGHSLCKALFLGGVTRRFPELNFAFLEGGVAWAASLFADLIGHWDKRNADAVERYNPAELDQALLAELLARYGGAWADKPTTADRGAVAGASADEPGRDEWAACGIERAEDIRDLFVPQLYFGCEADDPLTTTAFDRRANPFGARLNAVLGSDIAHWDVPDMTEVLGEAYEMVEKGLLTEDDFRDFVFTNPVSLYTRVNPSFFEGTVVESEVAALAASV